jgi:3-oxoacyl-[acyl-carrier protein] reductase
MNGDGRVALVTGAAQGLGRAIAERLARDGVSIAIGDIQYQGACDAAREIGTLGVECTALHLDVSSEKSVAQAYQHTLLRFGRLDILVNSAGISGIRAPLEEMPLSDWELILRINLTGAFLMCKAGIPLMKQRKWGRIVNVASLAARSRTGVGKCHYAASKAGMVGFSRVLADEVGHEGITVNCVAPSRTLTALTLANAAGNKDYFEQGVKQTAVGRLAEPMDTAHAVAFLCSDQASFITGTVIDVNGGAFMT